MLTLELWAALPVRCPVHPPDHETQTSDMSLTPIYRDVLDVRPGRQF
jgi:hypothetical protein